ncbi:31959_t:CDS:2, partial [Racocetra persica]
MPCYADTIVRVKFVKQTVKEDSNLLVVWALGVYPVEQEDYNIEMTLFAPVNPDDRDPESQALFKVDESNKCPLKVSLVGIPQEVPNEIKDDAIVQILVTDYVGQEVNFNMKVVFPCRNAWFTYVKDNIRPRESIINKII